MFETTIFTFSLIEIFSFCIGYSNILDKLETIVYSLCFKKQTLAVLLHLSFKVELLPTVEAIGLMLF